MRVKYLSIVLVVMLLIDFGCRRDISSMSPLSGKRGGLAPHNHFLRLK